MRRCMPAYLSLLFCAAYWCFALLAKKIFLHLGSFEGLGLKEVLSGLLLLSGLALALYSVFLLPSRGKILGALSLAFLSPFIADVACWIFMACTGWDGSGRGIFVLMTELLAAGGAGLTLLFYLKRNDVQSPQSTTKS